MVILKEVNLEREDASKITLVDSIPLLGDQDQLIEYQF